MLNAAALQVANDIIALQGDMDYLADVCGHDCRPGDECLSCWEGNTRMNLLEAKFALISGVSYTAYLMSGCQCSMCVENRRTNSNYYPF